VIGADPIGGGTSSSPKDGLGIAFPKYTIRDMVRAQHEMITKGLGITRLLAVGRASMGSFQTVEWGINFPDAMNGLIMIVPAARNDHHFAPIFDAFERCLRHTDDPGAKLTAMRFKTGASTHPSDLKLNCGGRVDARRGARNLAAFRGARRRLCRL